VEGHKLRQIIKRSRPQKVRIPDSFPVKNSNTHGRNFPSVKGGIQVDFIGPKMKKAILIVRFSAC